MALAYIITLEKELNPAPTPIKGATGKALARESDRLDFAAKRKDVTAITSMLSENPAALIAQLLEEGFDPARMRFPAEAWFNADEGLTTVRALIQHVTANLNDFKQPNPILRDLKSIELTLDAAHAAGVRFHFSKVDL